MRLVSFGGIAIASLLLAGCVVQNPPIGTGPATPAAPAVTAPTMLDAASRQVARNVINSEMQKRLPGVNVAPYSDCVINNASTAELIDLAQASRAGVAGAGESVAAIVTRPATTQCIAAAAKTA